MTQHDPARSTAPLQPKQPVTSMSQDERRAELAHVATLLHEVRDLVQDVQVFGLMPFMLRLLDRGEDFPDDGMLEAPAREFAGWLRAFVYYLFAAANVPDLRPHAVADARWALAQVGVPAEVIDAVGASGRLDRPVIEQLVALLLLERPWEDVATAGLEATTTRRGPRRRRGVSRGARRRGRP